MYYSSKLFCAFLIADNINNIATSCNQVNIRNWRDNKEAR